MATDLKERPASKHESFIDEQLARAERRIRFIDLSAALLGFVAGTLLFAAVMILLDRAFALTAATRQMCFLLYLGGAAAYLFYAVVRPLLWKVNPHYAARKLEDTLDSDRNHVINWIDLKEQKLPAVLKAALGQRAAKDLSSTDADAAIPGTRAFLAGGATAALLLTFVVMFFVLGLTPFLSLLGRAFFPFGWSGGIATRTQVSIVKPEGGDATVTIGNSVTIVASVTGLVPSSRDKNAPRLLYRYDPGEPYVQRYMQADDLARQWTATISPTDVKNGFWYKVTAGDAETAEYHVKARSAPGITDFLATYRYRKYVQKADRTRLTRRLEDLAGTEVVLLARANRDVREGKLIFDPQEGGTQTLDAEKVADDPRGMRFRLTLEKSGRYHIRFTTTDGDAAIERPEEVIVFPDDAPRVTLTEPGKDVTLPADGHLEIKGDATDDHGIARVELLLSLEGKTLKSIPYLADKLGTPEIGTPTVIEYRHVLELPALVDEKGKKVELKPGMKVEYRLMAADACDFREPNVARSEPAYTITIGEGQKNDQKDRDDARQKQKDHEKKHDDKLKSEKDKRDDQKKNEEKQEKEDQQKRDKEKQGGQGGKEPKDGGEGNKEDDKGGGNGAKDKKDDDTKRTAENLKNEMENRDRGEGKDEGKGGADDKGKAGEGKGGDKQGDGKEDGKPGEGPGSGMDGKGKASEGKDGGDTGKPAGPPDKGGKGEGKPSEGKDPGKQDGKPGQSRDKDRGKSDGKEKGERKPENGPGAGDKVREGKGKPSETEGKPIDDSKPGPQPPKKDGKPSEKTGNEPGTGEKDGKGKDGEGKRPKPEDAKSGDVQKAADQLKNGNAKQRQQAAKDLNDIANHASDEQAREAAKKAIEDAKQKGDLDKEGNAPGKAGEEKKGKDGEGAPGSGPGKADDKDAKEKEGKDGKPGKIKGRNDTPQGGPGDGSDKSRDPGKQDGSSGDEPPVTKQAPERTRPSQMQLEKFRKADQATLDKLKMSREQFDRFLRDYADLVKRQPAERPYVERLPAPSVGGDLPGMGGRAIEPKGTNTGGVKNEGRPTPPPGYGDAYKDVLKRLRDPK